MVLCQEVYLKDLLYQSEGTDNFVNSRVLDFSKLDSLGAIIEKVRICQSKHYSFERNSDIYELLMNIEKINMDLLDALSFGITGANAMTKENTDTVDNSPRDQPTIVKPQIEKVKSDKTKSQLLPDSPGSVVSPRYWIKKLT